MTQLDALVFARCAGFLFRAPGFSHPSVPPMVRAGLALVFTLGLVHGVAHDVTLAPVIFALALAGEIAIGAAIGIGASVLYDGAYAGGRLIEDYVGIRASVPSASVQPASGFGRLWSLVFLAGFFLLDGYHIVIRVFADGLTRIPPGATLTSHALVDFAIGLPTMIVHAALLITGPAILVIFIIQIGLAAIARVVPRFATFSLSFPIVFAAVLIVTMVAVPLLFGLAGHPWFDLPFLGLR